MRVVSISPWPFRHSENNQPYDPDCQSNYGEIRKGLRGKKDMPKRVDH